MGELTSKYVSNKAWARYKKIVRNFMDIDAGRQQIIWLRHVDQMLAFAEDSTPQFTAIPMEALCFYNAFRNWPIDKSTPSGALDEENLSIYVSTQAIEKLGLSLFSIIFTAESSCVKMNLSSPLLVILVKFKS